MLRILGFLLLVFAVGLGFAWLADRPGEMTVTFSGYQYQVSLMVAAVILAPETRTATAVAALRRLRRPSRALIALILLTIGDREDELRR